MKKPIRSLLKVLAFGSIMLLTFSTFGQTVVDNPNLDQVPQWYLDQSQNMRQQISQIVTDRKSVV